MTFAVKQLPFKPEMVRALLRECAVPGTGKTQTRRAIGRLLRFGPVTEFGLSPGLGYDWHFRDKAMRWHDLRDADLRPYLPIQPGNIVWVREAHYLTDDGHDGAAVYAADEDSVAEHLAGIEATRTRHDLSAAWAAPHKRLHPSIHMPRWASRITLVVTDVRIEQLQAICDWDAIAEGVGPLCHPLGRTDLRWVGTPEACMTPARAFHRLWVEINGADSWAGNPWVVAYTFRPILANIDDVLAEPAAFGVAA